MTKRTLPLITLLLACSLSLPAQQRVQLTHFEGLPITGLKASVSQVELRQGEPTGLTIEIDETLLPHLICDMKEGVVRIGLKKPMQRSWFDGKKAPLIKAVLTVEQLNYLSLSDMSSLSAEGILKTDGDTEIILSDMSKIGLQELDAERISLRCSDLSKISGGTFRAQDGVSLNVSDMSSASDIEVYADRLDVSVSDMSKVSVGGEVNSVGNMSSNDMSRLRYSTLKIKNK